MKSPSTLKAQTLDALDAYAAAGGPAHREEPSAVTLRRFGFLDRQEFTNAPPL